MFYARLLRVLVFLGLGAFVPGGRGWFLLSAGAVSRWCDLRWIGRGWWFVGVLFFGGRGMSWRRVRLLPSPAGTGQEWRAYAS